MHTHKRAALFSILERGKKKNRIAYLMVVYERVEMNANSLEIILLFFHVFFPLLVGVVFYQLLTLFERLHSFVPFSRLCGDFEPICEC